VGRAAPAGIEGVRDPERPGKGDGNWWNHMPLVVRFPDGNLTFDFTLDRREVAEFEAKCTELSEDAKAKAA
jgi:hypothetical protein